MALEQLPLLLLDEPGLVRVNEGWGRIAFVPRVAWEFLGPYFVVPTLSTRFLFPILNVGAPSLRLLQGRVSRTSSPALVLRFASMKVGEELRFWLGWRESLLAQTSSLPPFRKKR